MVKRNHTFTNLLKVPLRRIAWNYFDIETFSYGLLLVELSGAAEVYFVPFSLRSSLRVPFWRPCIDSGNHQFGTRI